MGTFDLDSVPEPSLFLTELTIGIDFCLQRISRDGFKEILFGD